jgi:2-haloacid dehalogenase
MMPFPSSPSFSSISLARRDLLAAAGAVTAGLLLGSPARSAERDLSGIKALTFDVYGSCTDYWGTIVRKGNDINRRKGLNLGWDKFVEDWRGLYMPTFEAIIDGKRPWQSVASIHEAALRDLVRKQGIDHLSDSDLTEINDVWEHLDPWPDTIPGLARLKQRYVLSALSNADMSGMVNLAKHSGLTWDVILAAELAQTFKPAPKVYQLASRYLGLKPEEILMVACHKFDLRGAKAQGFRTAFVARPLELGVHGTPDTEYEPEFDLNVASFLELADQLHL